MFSPQSLQQQLCIAVLPRAKMSPIFFLLSVLHVAIAHRGHDDAIAAAADENRAHLRSGALILAKVWCMVLVFAGTFVGGVSPYFMKWNEGFLVAGTHFAGGVFLGTALMHFLSDANEVFDELTDRTYPFAFMLASLGFLVTMAIDCAVSSAYRKKSCEPFAEEDDAPPARVEQGNGTYLGNLGTNMQGHPSTISSIRVLGDTILLMVALCFHSIFEGIAIGVAVTEGDAWKALWTISLHKVFAAIAMGIALLRMAPNRPLFSCVAYAFSFAISSPIGVAIGIVIDATAQGPTANWIFAISMAFACGIFIYVSINHLISKPPMPHPIVPINPPFCRLFSVGLGVIVIAIVMIWDT